MLHLHYVHARLVERRLYCSQLFFWASWEHQSAAFPNGLPYSRCICFARMIKVHLPLWFVCAVDDSRKEVQARYRHQRRWPHLFYSENVAWGVSGSGILYYELVEAYLHGLRAHHVWTGHISENCRFLESCGWLNESRAPNLGELICWKFVEEIFLSMANCTVNTQYVEISEARLLDEIQWQSRLEQKIAAESTINIFVFFVLTWLSCFIMDFDFCEPFVLLWTTAFLASPFDVESSCDTLSPRNTREILDKQLPVVTLVTTRLFHAPSITIRAHDQPQYDHGYYTPRLKLSVLELKCWKRWLVVWAMQMKDLICKKNQKFSLARTIHGKPDNRC